MGTMRRKEYRAYDGIAVGDIVDLGGQARRVLGVSRDDHDRVRWVEVDRLACGYAKDRAGNTVSYCTGPVHLYHTDLHFKGSRYRFRGWFWRARLGDCPTCGRRHGAHTPDEQAECGAAHPREEQR